MAQQHLNNGDSHGTIREQINENFTEVYTALEDVESGGGGGTGDAVTTDGLNQFAATTSAELRGVIIDETGTGSLVFATSPTLVTPILGTPTSGVLTNCTAIPAAGIVGVIPIANLATGTATGSKFIRDDGTLQAIPGGGDALVANPLSQFAATTSAQLRGVLSDETGTGSAVFATSPTLVTPIIGTPTSGTLTNCTGLPMAGVTGLTAALADKADLDDLQDVDALMTKAVYDSDDDGILDLPELKITAATSLEDYGSEDTTKLLPFKLAGTTYWIPVVVALGGSGGPSYLVDEGFEGTGAPSGWTASGTPDWDYTTTALVGSQSLRLAVSSSSAYKTFSSGSPRYAYFQLRPTTIAGSDINIGLADSGVTGFTAALTLTSAGVVTLSSGSSESSASATAIAINTTYHVWIKSVTSGTCELAISTTGTKPTVDGSGAVFLTVSGGIEALDTGSIFFQNGTGVYILDRVLVSDSVIGNNP